MNILDLMSFFLPPWGRITRVGIDRTAIGYTPDPPASPAAARAVSGHASEAALSETIDFRLPICLLRENDAGVRIHFEGCQP
jgi:hypothetical protein